ncbi:MAG: hypothetical protein O2960_09935 [Verrucomicrobia bacterium]|nr:hypothetical protein [Verrucomicrobiota bacterium]
MNSAGNLPKSGLGRGLNELMPDSKGTGYAGVPEATGIPGIGSDHPVGHGLNTLLTGTGKRKPESLRVDSSSMGRPSGTSSATMLKFGLVCADTLLVLQAALIVLGRERTLGLSETVLCAVSIGVGAWLSVLAIRLHFPRH